MVAVSDRISEGRAASESSTISKSYCTKPALSPIAKAVRLSLLSLGLIHGVSHAATIEVTTHLDDNGSDCSLRQAMISINSASLQGGCVIGVGSFGTNDSITFSNILSSNTITLTDGQVEISPNTSVSIDASTITGGITLDANQASRVLSVNSATLIIDRMTLLGGSSVSSGGGISIDESQITLNNSVVSENYSYGEGGGLSIRDSTVSLNNCIVSGNASNIDGGGLDILNSFVSLNNSTVSGNTAYFQNAKYNAQTSSEVIMSSNPPPSHTSSGGGIHVDQSTLNINVSDVSGNFSSGRANGFGVRYSIVNLSRTTVSENIGGSFGGGFFVSESTVNLSNSTVSGNSINNSGAGFFLGRGLVNLQNSTLSDNYSSTEGTNSFHISSGGTTVSLSNSVLAKSTLEQSFIGDVCKIQYVAVGDQTPPVILSDSASIVEDASCLTNARIIDAGLLPLADNGGPTKTHGLKADSKAGNTGILASCALRDQRGKLRYNGDGLCDVGAFELNSTNNVVVFSLGEDGDFFVVPVK